MDRIALSTREMGEGARVAVLIHGLMGSAESWWRVAPEIARRGYRVIAVDLPGHGDSPQDEHITIDRAASHIARTLRVLGADEPELAIGHSIGGTVLASMRQAAPARAIFVEAPLRTGPPVPAESARRDFTAAKADRTYERLREIRPWYSDEDARAEARAADVFNIETAVALAGEAISSRLPTAAATSLVVRAAPSNFVTDDDVRALKEIGVTVRDIASAAHSVWYSHYHEFMTAIDDWY